MELHEFKDLVEQLLNAEEWRDRASSDLEFAAATSEVNRLRGLVKNAIDNVDNPC